MATNGKFQGVRKAALAALAMGMLWGSSCATGLDALVAGVGAASRELDRGNRFDNIGDAFDDWLVDEILDF